MPTNLDQPCKCDNCGYEAPYKKARAVARPTQRIDFGQPYSDAECPRCGALMYPTELDADTFKELHEAEFASTVTYKSEEMTDEIAPNQETVRRLEDLLYKPEPDDFNLRTASVTEADPPPYQWLIKLMRLVKDIPDDNFVIGYDELQAYVESACMYLLVNQSAKVVPIMVDLRLRVSTALVQFALSEFTDTGRANDLLKSIESDLIEHTP